MAGTETRYLQDFKCPSTCGAPLVESFCNTIAEVELQWHTLQYGDPWVAMTAITAGTISPTDVLKAEFSKDGITDQMPILG